MRGYRNLAPQQTDRHTIGKHKGVAVLDLVKLPYP